MSKRKHTPIPRDTPIYRAKEAAGTVEDLAELIDRTPRQTYKYLRTPKLLPADKAVVIEEALGVPRHELRPDLFLPPADEPPKKKRRAA